jgi:hypothetical protein
MAGERERKVWVGGVRDSVFKGGRNILTVNVLRQWVLVLLVEVRLREGKALKVK